MIWPESPKCMDKHPNRQDTPWIQSSTIHSCRDMNNQVFINKWIAKMHMYTMKYYSVMFK